jgi:hypothetical protein
VCVLPLSLILHALWHSSVARHAAFFSLLLLQVISVPSCLSDPSLTEFKVDECPGLLRMLDALSLGNVNPVAVCDITCAVQFSKLNETCFDGLVTVFGKDTSSIGKLGTAFIADCQRRVNPPVPAPAPVLAPAPATEAPDTAPIAGEE